MKTQMINNITPSYSFNLGKPTRLKSEEVLSVQVDTQKKGEVPNSSKNNEATPDIDQLSSMVGKVNTNFEYVQKSLHFRLHKSTGKMMVEVTDAETGEIIKTMPPEWFLNVLGRIRTALGTFIDEEV